MSNETPRCVITDEEIADPETALKVGIVRGATEKSLPFDTGLHLVFLSADSHPYVADDTGRSPRLNMDHVAYVGYDGSVVMVRTGPSDATTYHGPGTPDENVAELIGLLNEQVLP